MHELLVDFWEHIEDLRRTLLQSLVVVGVGFLFLFLFYQPILHFIAAYPIEKGKNGVIRQKVQRMQIVNETNHNQNVELPIQARLISPLKTPVEEKEGKKIYKLLSGEILLYEEVASASFLIMGPIEGLVLVVKACFWLSLGLTAPIWGWFWLQFISPGLKEQEKMILFPFLLFSFIFLAIGITFSYYVTLPIANQYLLFFNSLIGENSWTLMLYVDYVLLLCLGHAVAAELALLLFILVHYHILSVDWLIEKRRYMIVAAFILGALLTPPDIFTQLLLALPLVGLYEVAIQYARWRSRSVQDLTLT